MAGRGNKRGHGGEDKEWSPFSGVGRRLSDEGEISQSVGDGGKTPSGTSSAAGSSSPQRRVRSMTSGSGRRSTEIHNDVVDLEAESGNACPFLDHPGWACMVRMPSNEEWQQNDRWTLADLVVDSVRSQVFASGDIGSQLLPEGELVVLRNLLEDESPPSMVVVLQRSALAILCQSLCLLGHDATDNLPCMAELCLREAVITPLQYKYFMWLSDAKPE